MVYLTERAGRQATHRNRHQHGQRQQREQEHRLPAEPRDDGMASSAAIDPPIGTPDIIIVATGPAISGQSVPPQAHWPKAPGRPGRCRREAAAPRTPRPGSERTQDGEHRQHHRASDDGAPAADRVGQPAREHRADHHPDERQGAEGARRGGADPPVPLQAGRSRCRRRSGRSRRRPPTASRRGRRPASCGAPRWPEVCECEP